MKITSMVAFCPATERTMVEAPGEMPFTVHVALPVASVNAPGVTVATVGEVLTALTSIPKSGPPSLSSNLTKIVSSEPEQILSLCGVTMIFIASPYGGVCAQEFINRIPMHMR